MFIKNEQSENLNEVKKYMADELLEKLRSNSEALYLLERVGYTEELIMNLVLKYDQYSGLDIISCIYAIEANENNKKSYLDNGSQKKESLILSFFSLI